MNLIKNLRYEMWARSIHFSGFARQQRRDKKPEKRIPDLNSAVFYAARYL